MQYCLPPLYLPVDACRWPHTSLRTRSSSQTCEDFSLSSTRPTGVWCASLGCRYLAVRLCWCHSVLRCCGSRALQSVLFSGPGLNGMHRGLVELLPAAVHQFGHKNNPDNKWSNHHQRFGFGPVQEELEEGNFNLSSAETQQLLSQMEVTPEGDITFPEFVASLVDWNDVRQCSGGLGGGGEGSGGQSGGSLDGVCGGGGGKRGGGLGGGC